MIAISESHRRASAFHEAGHAVAALACGLTVHSVTLVETKVSGHAPDLGYAIMAASGCVAVMFMANVGHSTSATLSPSDRALIDAAGTSFGIVGVAARRLLQSQSAVLESFADSLVNSRDGTIDRETIAALWWTNHDMDALTTWRAAHSAYCSPVVHAEAVRVGLRTRRIDAAMRAHRGEAALARLRRERGAG